MDIVYQSNGNLPAGVHLMTVEEFTELFGYNIHRKKLIEGLKKGMNDLKACGCKKIFIDGSFVTTKETPGDFDACWDANGVDLKKLMDEFPTIVDFSNERKNQKALYFGEFFPAHIPASSYMIYLDFFQRDRDNNPKGIVQINLN